MGKLTLTVFLALCPALGNAFVVRALGSTPVDSPRKRQASASLGAPLEIGGRKLSADGALSVATMERTMPRGAADETAPCMGPRGWR